MEIYGQSRTAIQQQNNSIDEQSQSYFKCLQVLDVF